MANKTFVVQYLIKAREQFAEAANKTRTATQKMREEMERTQKTFNKVGGAMQRAGAKMTLGISAPLALMGFSMKNAARDAEETRSKFNAVFKDMSGDANKAADSLAGSFGLTGTKARDLVGDTGDLLTGFGFSQEAALGMSLEVNKLAVDLASFKNFSGGAEGASAALTKGLLGERESMKSLGIAILDKDVQTQISTMLSNGQTFASKRQAVAQATLVLALKQSKNAIGDFAATQHQLANQERITSSRIQDLKESFGAVLMPVALKLTQVIRKMAEALLSLSPETKKVIVLIAAVAAAVGPLLVMLGTMVKLWPLLTLGAKIFARSAISAMLPFLPVILAVAAGAALIMYFWEELSEFFTGFGQGISESMGSTLPDLIANFKEAAGIISGLFGEGSEANESLSSFTEVGRMMGNIVGETVRLLVNGLSGIGAILGQVVAAAVTMDFSQFDAAAIKAEFLGSQATPVAAETNVNVGVNVGLDGGLKQTSDASVSGGGARRADVGVN